MTAEPNPQVVESQKEESDLEMDKDNNGDEGFAQSSSDDLKLEKSRKWSHGRGPTDNVVQFKDYIGSKKEFWRESFVKAKLIVSMINKTIFNEHFYILLFLVGC